VVAELVLEVVAELVLEVVAELVLEVVADARLVVEVVAELAVIADLVSRCPAVEPRAAARRRHRELSDRRARAGPWSARSAPAVTSSAASAVAAGCRPRPRSGPSMSEVRLDDPQVPDRADSCGTPAA